MNKTCKKCGAENDAEMRFCQKCGGALGGGEAEDAHDETVSENRESVSRTTIRGSKWQTVNTWANLVKGAQGKEQSVFNAVEENLKEVDVPDLLIERRDVRYGGLAEWFSGSRQHLVVEHRKFAGYHVFVSIADYGKQLHVSWYLMARRTLGIRFILLCTKNWVLALLFIWWLVPFLKMYYAWRGITAPELMNSFDLEELSAFGTTVHHAVTDAVKELMDTMGMDFSKVDTKSRGFLNIS